ncbi:hypothetical protein D3C86_1302760 [compost metagenome]
MRTTQLSRSRTWMRSSKISTPRTLPSSSTKGIWWSCLSFITARMVLGSSSERATVGSEFITRSAGSSRETPLKIPRRTSPSVMVPNSLCLSSTTRAICKAAVSIASRAMRMESEGEINVPFQCFTASPPLQAPPLRASSLPHDRRRLPRPRPNFRFQYVALG